MAGWESNKFKVHAIAAVPFDAEALALANSVIGDFAKMIQGGNFATDEAVAEIVGAQPGKGLYYLYDFDILQYNDAWELNAIPSANLSIAVGRRADAPGDVNKVSAIHDAVTQLRIQVPIVVYCKADRLDSGPFWFSEWPVNDDNTPREFVLFRGYVTGGGFSRSFGDARYTMALAHWLVDMNFSSACSRSTHPITANSWFYPATFEPNSSSGGGIVAPYIGTAVAGQFFQAHTLGSDFWGGHNPQAHITTDYSANTGMKAFLTHISHQDRINSAEINRQTTATGAPLCLLATPGKNTEALRALSRFEPFDNGNKVADVGPTGYRLGVPLVLDLKTASSTFTASNIADEIGREGMEMYTSVTLWDKLAGQFHANYLFSIVPTVETALVVPFIPGLRGPAHRNIFSYEYGTLNTSINLQRALRGVGVLMGRTWAAGANLNREKGPTFGSIGGWYDVCRDGMIHFKMGPRWLKSVQPGFWGASASLAAGAPIRTAVGGDGSVRSGPSPAQLFADAKPLWNAYAQALYVHELLKHRQGQLSGRVRFDIAPGSLVKIEASEDRFVNWLKGQVDTMWIWATVLRVSTTIDAESCKAGTAFHLAHIRTDAENARADTSVPRHPLWLCQWSGCALIDDEAFDPVATHDIGCPTAAGTEGDGPGGAAGEWDGPGDPGPGGDSSWGTESNPGDTPPATKAPGGPGMGGGKGYPAVAGPGKINMPGTNKDFFVAGG